VNGESRAAACRPIGYGRDLVNIIGVIFFHFIFFLSLLLPLGYSKLGFHVLKILLVEMPTMSGRVRPIEKFAEAVGKCSVEVRSRVSYSLSLDQH
jgi:hypothetical protein